MEQIILITMFILLILLNVLVSIKLIKRVELTSFQKIAQCFIIWLMPLLGALLIFAFMRNEDKIMKSSYKSFGGGSVERRNYWT